MKRTGLILIGVLAALVAAAPLLAPHASDDQFAGLLHAPPTVPRVRDAAGRWHRPFIYRWQLVSQLEQRFEADESRRVPLAFFANGHLVQSADEPAAPLLLLGADSFGRDVFARLAYGGRLSLAVALVAGIGALALGLLVGGVAGYAGGSLDEALMRGAEFVLVLPAIYLVLALRAVLPLVLPAPTSFLLLTGILACVGSPHVARGVRAIVAAERRLDYAAAATSLGAGHTRLLVRHLLPASAGFVLTQFTMLLPAFILAEATLSYVGLGFPESVASWGAMLHDASNVSGIADFPWTLSPAGAIFLVVLALNLAAGGSDRSVPTRPIIPT